MQLEKFSPLARRSGIVVSTAAALFLAFDGVIKIARIEPVLQSFAELGLPESLAVFIGALELSCLALYVIPRTAALGAVFLTGFLGGAVALKVRVEAPLFSHTLFGVYTGTLLWLGLLLRKPSLRALLLSKESV